MSSSFSSSSSYTASKSSYYRKHFQYDVFLSFRGDDTRHSFTSHLQSALTNSNVITFMDDKSLQKGTGLESELWLAIEGSRISIVVFSIRYSASRWCLNELVKIMECHRSYGQVVLPVFYHVDPSDVRHQKGAFGDEFRRFIRNRLDTPAFSAWRGALGDVANFSGWHITGLNYESDVTKTIVQYVLRKLDNTSLPTTDFPVGLESRAQDAIKLLKGQSSKVCVLGIWGMGGSGKTTLAKVIYNKIHGKFRVSSFLSNIREAWDTNRGHIDLQEQLLSDILQLKNMKIHNIEWGKAMIKERLCGAKALVVLDDNEFWIFPMIY